MLVQKLTPDNLYYNLEISGKLGEDTKAIFNVNRADTILENPSDYYLGIVDFRIPLFSIPLFSFKTGLYKFSLEFDGLILEDTLIWVPETANTSPVQNAVYSYQSMIQSMNESLKRLYDAMQLAKPINFLATEQLFITLQNNLITINVEDWYYLNNAFLYSNEPLYAYLRSIAVFFVNDNLIRFNYFDHMPNYIRNTKTYYKLTQQNVEIDNWNSLRRILFETNSIPVSPEVIGSQSNIQIIVLGDYVHIPNVNRPLFYDFINKGPIRLYDLESNYPMRQVDVTVRWFSEDNQTDIIIIPYGETFYIKMAFIKKEEEVLMNIDNLGKSLK
jgi:hypothetical protein